MIIIACNEDSFNFPLFGKNDYTITNTVDNFEVRINVNGNFYKLKRNECAQVSTEQFASLQVEARPSLIQVAWLEFCEAKQDNNMCDIEEGSWLNLCQSNHCTAVAHYEINISGNEPFIRQVENKNDNICLNLTEN